MATFKEAFREARKAGDKTFTWNGKKYTTEYKEEAEAKKLSKASKDEAGAFRSRRAEATPSEAKKEAPMPVKAAPRASAAKEEEESGMSKRLRSAGLTAKGAEEAGGLGSSVLAALGVAGGAGANVAKAAKAKKAAEAAKTAAKEFSKPSAAQVSKETGRRFTAKEEMEAATSAAKGAAARKPIQAARAKREAEVAESTARGAATRAAMAEKRKQLAADYQKMLDKYASKKSSPRDRTREKAEFEFKKGGAVKKGKK